MGVPDAFLPRNVEDSQLQAYRTFSEQLRAYASDAKAVDRGQRLLARYREKPWLSPGIATAFTKWEEQFGTHAARQLAGTAFEAAQEETSQKKINKQLEDFVATKDFQRQVKAYRESQQPDDQGWFGDFVDNVPVVGAVKGIAEGKSIGEITLRAVPGAKVATTIDKAIIGGAGETPGVGPSIKGISRAGFTALESPYQEVQAATSSVLAHGVQAFTGAAQSTASGHAPVGNDLSTVAPSLTNPVSPVDNGLIVGNQSPFGTSSGAIALSHLAQGENVDLGTGFLPGGEVEKEHTRAVRNIAAFRYGGQTHFATPGRIFASTVTEPGTDPYNVLSGLVDAAAIIKADPANIALTQLGELRQARKGFAAAPEIADAGGFGSWVRSFVDPPTVDRYLASRTGTVLKEELARMGPDQFAELGRRTNWSWPSDVMTGVTNATTPDAVDAVLRPALGTTIDRQPALHSFAASIRNSTAQHALLSEIPAVRVNIGQDALGGTNGSLKALYNHGLGLGLSDGEISAHLYDIANSAGRVERSEGLINYMKMEESGLLAKGLPPEEATRLTRFAKEDLTGKARTYFDRQIATGETTPGVVLTGEAFPLEKPYLLSEHLGDNIYLTPLQGKGGRNEALAKYGRILGIPGTSYGDMTDEFGLAKQGLAADLSTGGRAIKNAAWQSNAFLTHMQNSLWKPLALIRGAWMVRVLGEEQVRMAMAGYDSIFNHPIRYFAWMASKKEGELPEALDWASEMGGLRNSQRGAFGLTDPNQTAYGKIIARDTSTFSPEDIGHANVWANKLTAYSEDPMMSQVAKTVHGELPLDDLKNQFWAGNLTKYRADLSNDPNFLANGIDLSTKEGADAYIDGLYDRLHYYTSGDGDLIKTVATGKYKPNLEAIARRRSLKGQTLEYNGTPVQVVDHNAGANNATILIGNQDERIAVSQLDLPDTSAQKILTKNRDNVALDRQFVAHLASKSDDVKPIEISGTHNVRESAHADSFVNFMFANMMDKPTAYLNRSQVFAQEYYNQIERLLPHMDPAARTEALAEARATIGGHRALHGRMKDLEEAAARGGELRTTEYGTKIVDESGKPLRVYHGTTDTFDQFVADKKLYKEGGAFYFTSDPKQANFYTKMNSPGGGYETELAERGRVFGEPQTRMHYLDIKNPYHAPAAEGGAFSAKRIEELKAQGYDGIIYHEGDAVEGGAVAYAVFDPRQVRNFPNELPSTLTKSGLSFDEAEVIAKGHSLDSVRELLYDTHRKNKGLAAIQLLMPFGEAWKEMLGSWARIVAEKPQTIRKFQVAITAARGANPFDYVPGAIPGAMQGRGFFYKDPANGGADNFVYPWSGAINEQLIGVPIPFTAQGQNLSMGFNLLPGIGPVFQMPAMYALNNYLSDPKWDPIRHLVSPYGTGDVSGGIIEQAFLPAYMKKLMTASGMLNPDANAGSQSAKALNSTISDIMKYRASVGEADLNSQAGITKAYKEASKDARWLYVIQGSFQFGAPAAPKANFLAQTKNGNLVQFDLLRTALGKLYQEDPNTAVSKFVERYGERAMYATAPKTLGETFGEQFTKTAVDWERRHPELATKYPMSFALFAPTKKGEEFSYDQYFQALGQRTTLPAKDAIKRQNNVLGSMWYDRIRQQMGLKRGQVGTTSQRAYLQEKRNEIHAGYPGWREIATDDSRLPRAIEEITQAVNDPEISKSRPALAKAVQAYLTERTWVMDQVKARGGSGDFQTPNFANAARWAPYREHLRQTAESLGAKNPAFLTLWEDTFDREMTDDG